MHQTMSSAAPSPRASRPCLAASQCKLTGTTRPAPKKLRSMRWLHFPKCGTSFGTALMHYACPAIPEDSYPHKCVQAWAVYRRKEHDPTRAQNKRGSENHARLLKAKIRPHLTSQPTGPSSVVNTISRIAGVSEYMLVFKRHYLRPQYCDSEISVGSISGHTPLNVRRPRQRPTFLAGSCPRHLAAVPGWLLTYALLLHCGQKTLQQNPDSVVAMFRDPRRRDYSGMWSGGQVSPDARSSSRHWRRSISLSLSRLCSTQPNPSFPRLAGAW